jgi:hypothetical protein
MAFVRRLGKATIMVDGQKIGISDVVVTEDEPDSLSKAATELALHHARESQVLDLWDAIDGEAAVKIDVVAGAAGEAWRNNVLTYAELAAMLLSYGLEPPSETKFKQLGSGMNSAGIRVAVWSDGDSWQSVPLRPGGSLKVATQLRDKARNRRLSILHPDPHVDGEAAAAALRDDLAALDDLLR